MRMAPAKFESSKTFVSLGGTFQRRVCRFEIFGTIACGLNHLKPKRRDGSSENNIPYMFTPSHLPKNKQALPKDVNQGNGSWYIGLVLSFLRPRNQDMGSNLNCSIPKTGRKVDQPEAETLMRMTLTHWFSSLSSLEHRKRDTIHRARGVTIL